MIGKGISPFLTRYSGSGLLSPIFIIIAGQSNARGQGTPFPAEYQGDIDNGNIWTGAAFATLNGSVSNNNQLGQAQGTFGAEMSLIKDLLSRHSAVYCMKYAVGGTSLASVAQGGTASNWNASTVGSLYDTFVSYTNLAIADLPVGYITGGAFWFQGEKDGETSALAQLYYSNLSAFWSAYKTATNQPNLKVYIKRVLNSYDVSNQYTPKVRGAQTSFVNAFYGDFYLLDQDSMGNEADQTHLTAAGYIASGLADSAALATTPPQRIILNTDDFAGAVITTKYWASTGGTINQNNKISFPCPHTSVISFGTRLLLNRFSVWQNTLVVRVKMSWTDPVMTNEASGGLMTYKDASNYIAIMTDASVAGGNALKIRKRVGAVNTDTACSAVNGDDIKIVHNCSTGVYSCYKWSAGAWVSIGSGTGAHTGQTLAAFTASDNTTLTGGDEYIFENFDCAVADFSTQRPVV